MIRGLEGGSFISINTQNAMPCYYSNHSFPSHFVTSPALLDSFPLTEYSLGVQNSSSRGTRTTMCRDIAPSAFSLHLCKIYTALLLTGYIYRHIQKKRRGIFGTHTETRTAALIYNFAFSLTLSWGFVRLSAAARSLSTRLRILPLADLGMDLEG